MAIQVVLAPKDPREIIPYEIDFAPDLQPNETISTVTASVTFVQGPGDGDPANLLQGSYSIIGTKVQQFIKAGISGNTYELTFLVTTSLAQTLVGVGRFVVSSV